MDKKDPKFRLMTDRERQEFWTFVEQTTAVVDSWPDWKRGAPDPEVPSEGRREESKPSRQKSR